MKITMTSQFAFNLVARQYENLASQAATLNERCNGDSMFELDATPAQVGLLEGLVYDAIAELECLQSKLSGELAKSVSV